MIWIMKEARTTNQPQPPSGGGTERGRGSTCGAVLSLSVAVGDFSRGGEALTGISLVLRSTLTGSSLSGPAILSQTMSSLLTKKTVIHFQIALSVLLTDKISRRQFPVSFYVKTIASRSEHEYCNYSPVLLPLCNIPTMQRSLESRNSRTIT